MFSIKTLKRLEAEFKITGSSQKGLYKSIHVSVALSVF